MRRFVVKLADSSRYRFSNQEPDIFRLLKDRKGVHLRYMKKKLECEVLEIPLDELCFT